MALNPITCGNCGTKNPPDAEFCQQCDEPLTRSGAKGMREQEEAQVEGGVFGVGEDDAEFDHREPDEVASPRNPHRRGT